MNLLVKIKKVIPIQIKENFLLLSAIIFLPFLKKEIEQSKDDFFRNDATFKRRIAMAWVRHKFYKSKPDEQKNINVNQYWGSKAGYNWHKTKLEKYKNNPNDPTFLKWRLKPTKELKTILEQKKEYNSLFEIGTGHGLFLDYLSEEIKTIDNFVGVDISPEMIKECKKNYSNKKNISFFEGEIFDCLKSKEFENKTNETISIISYGTLIFFTNESIKELLDYLKLNFKKVLFTLIERVDFDLDKVKESKKGGSLFTFSHNYPIILKDSDYQILWDDIQIVDSTNNYKFVSIIAEYKSQN